MTGWLDSVIGVAVFLFIVFILYKPFAGLLKGFWEWLSGIFGRLKGDGNRTSSSSVKSINYE